MPKRAKTDPQTPGEKNYQGGSEVDFGENPLFRLRFPIGGWKGVKLDFSEIRWTFDAPISKLRVQIEKVALTIFKHILVLAKTRRNRSPDPQRKKLPAGFWA